MQSFSFTSWSTALSSFIAQTNQQSKSKKYSILVVVGLAGFCVVRHAFWKMYNKIRGYPAGPLGVPLLGCLVSFGSNPFAFLAHCGSSYGPLCYFPLLSSNNILISDPKVMQRLYKTEKLINRPSYSYRKPATATFTALSGVEWQTQRKLAAKTVINAMSSAFVLSNVNESITEYIAPMMDEKYASKSSLCVPRDFMFHIAFDNLWCAVFGVSLPLNDPFLPQYTKCVEDTAFGLGNDVLLGMMTDYSRHPMLNFVKWHVSQKYFAALDELVQAWLNNHGFVVDANRNILHRSVSIGNGNQNQPLYIDALIEAVKNKQMTAKKAVAEIGDILAAGIDTTAHTGEYMFILLAKHPQVQEMVYNELQTVMQKNNLKTFDFRILTELHIFRAFIFEALRISSVSAMGGVHIAHRDVEIQVDGKQCVIPKGTLLLANIHYMHKYADWNNNNKPLQDENNDIHLEYWLDDDKIFKMNDNFITFGVGKRDCLGRSLAVKALYATVGLMMCKYRFVAANDDPKCIEIKQAMSLVLNIDPPIGIKVEKR